MQFKPRWQVLPKGEYSLEPSMAGVDPMWLWADATQFCDHRLDGRMPWFVVERPDVPDRFSSERLTPDEALLLIEQDCRIELSMPVLPQRPPNRPPADSESDTPRSPQAGTSEVLVGVIDSGCPFAARMLRDATGTGTRVIGLWDQDDTSGLARVDGAKPWVGACGWALDGLRLNDLMQQALSGGHVDEARCYRLAGDRAMRTRSSHGAAVLSQLFGKPLWGGALQPRPGDPPSWDRDGTPIDEADVVFVQVPCDAQQDSTSASLTRHVLDGLRYIVAHAGATTQRIVVNISTGTSRTAHDGTSMLEQGLKHWVDRMRSKGIELVVVLPTGNTNLEQRHALLQRTSSHLELFIPPCSEMPQYVTVRWPKEWKGTGLRLIPPGGGADAIIFQGQAQALFGAHGIECGVISPVAGPNEPPRSLIAFAPTQVDDRHKPAAKAGRWRIELVPGPNDSSSQGEAARFWISRNQRNPGAVARGRQAYFIDWDESYDPRRFLARRYDDDPARPATSGIRREGALSGMATACLTGTGIVAAGGYLISTAHKPPPPDPEFAHYSARAGFAFVAPSDTSWVLQGMSVRGNCAGEIVRMVGTSFAAPLLARAIVNKGSLPDDRFLLVDT